MLASRNFGPCPLHNGLSESNVPCKHCTCGGNGRQRWSVMCADRTVSVLTRISSVSHHRTGARILIDDHCFWLRCHGAGFCIGVNFAALTRAGARG